LAYIVVLHLFLFYKNQVKWLSPADLSLKLFLFCSYLNLEFSLTLRKEILTDLAGINAEDGCKKFSGCQK